MAIVFDAVSSLRYCGGWGLFSFQHENSQSCKIHQELSSKIRADTVLAPDSLSEGMCGKRQKIQQNADYHLQAEEYVHLHCTVLSCHLVHSPSTQMGKMVWRETWMR